METRKHARQAFFACLPLLCCLAASLTTAFSAQAIMAACSFHWSKTVNWSALAIVFTIPVGWTAIVIFLEQRRILTPPKSLQLLFTILFVAFAGNAVWNFWPLLSYGDSFGVNMAISTNEVFHRWFLGTTVLSWIYHALWPAFGAYLPNKLANIDIFVRITSAALMWMSAIVFLQYYGAKFRLIIPLLSPIWLLFCSGYNEYYPFVVWEYLLFLLLLSGNLAKQSPILIAAISSIMCLSYGAFVAPAVLLMVFYSLSVNPGKALTMILMMAALCVCLLILLWPDNILSFFVSYYYSLPLGEKNILFEPYLHKSASPTSALFALSYAFSFEHIFHLCFMLIFGAGPLLILFFAGGLLVLSKKEIPDKLSDIKPMFFLAVCLAMQFAYFFLMLPKFGPVLDVDLFFMVYLTFGFVAGIFVDTFLDTVKDEARRVWKQCITASVLSGSAVILFQLRWIGIS